MPLDDDSVQAIDADTDRLSAIADQVHPIDTTADDRSDAIRSSSAVISDQDEKSGIGDLTGTDRPSPDCQVSEETTLNNLPTPRCIVAGAIHPVEAKRHEEWREELEGYRYAQLSPDGTCLLAHTYDSLLYTYVLPSNLLDPSVELELKPYATTKCAPSIRAFASTPHFTLADPSTCLIATSVTDHPIRLTNAIDPSMGVVSTYRHVNPMTEAFIVPQSLLFNSEGTHLLSGSNNGIIAIHDLSRNGNEPVLTWNNGAKTTESHRAGINGIVSSLDISCTGVLAAGTFMNDVGLYSTQGFGEKVATFSTYLDPSGIGTRYHSNRSWSGSGITQLRWSPCGNYLIIAGRMSDVILIYDLRRGKLLSWLVGRRAVIHQRLTFDVIPAGNGWEVWAGGTDGCVRVWRNPHERDGPVDAVAEWKAHDHPVTSTLLHSCGIVAATLAMEDRNSKVSRNDTGSSSGSESEDDENADESNDDDSVIEDEDDSSDSSSASSSGRSRAASVASATPIMPKGDRLLKIWSI